MKIREKFLPEILAGTKSHEYRLASPDKANVKVGDTIVLISNKNKQNFVKVTVKGIRNYKDWEEALKDNWHQDFKNLYTSFQDALYECYKFYTKKEVEDYGIVSFSVEPIKTDYNNMTVLLDTNIMIKRESGNNASYEVSSLFNWFGKKKIPTYIHNLTINELSRYKDETAKAAILTKLNAYNVLPSFPRDEDYFFTNTISQYSQNKNGKVDNELLREIYDDNIDVLLSDDNLILRKAEDLYIRDRVLTSSELLAYFETKYPQNIEYKMLAVKLKKFNEIALNSVFFNSLREDYGGADFDKWFKKKALQNEQAYVFEDTTGLKGFLYLKSEDENESYSDITPEFTPKKRLKVGTFKIERTGFRLNERFLKIIFDNARKYNVKEIYVTLFEEKREEVKQLKTIMEQWGFAKLGYKSNGEAVLVKTLEFYNEKSSPKLNFPLIQDNLKHYFLPIYPQYHTDMFPDMILKNENMHLYEENKAHRYAIEKIYLTGAYNIQAKIGDLVLIYRTGDRFPKRYSSVVTGIAIIGDIIRTNNVDECISLCKNRSIFSEEEIRGFYNKYPTIIKLLDYVAFKNKVTLNELYEAKIIAVDSGPRPFEILTKEQFEVIYKLGMEEE